MDMEMFDPAADNGNGGWYGIGDLPEDDDYYFNMLLQNGNDILWINSKKRGIAKYGSSDRRCCKTAPNGRIDFKLSIEGSFGR